MANQSIFNDRWIDLVFENRNKEYGAYQLRHENPKTTLKALGIGFLLITLVLSIPMFMNKFGTKPGEIICNLPSITLVEMTDITFPPEKKPDLQSATPLTQKENNKPKPEITKENIRDPKVTESENAKTEVATNEEAQETYTEPTEGAISGTENSGVLGGTGTSTETNVTKTSGTNDDNGTHITAILDKQPSFPGGMDKFYTYVARNFKAPETQLSNTVKVFVSFVIEKDGSMTDIRVIRNPGYGLDKEAIRVLKSLKTKWVPGILNGKPVRTAYNLPIIVELK